MYLDLIRIRFLMMLAYRVNYYSGIIIYSVNIGAYYFFWHAIYGDQDTIRGFTLAQMTTYVAVTWMARAFYFNNLDREIANEVRDGSIAIQFVRPYNYLLVKMFQGFGEGLFRLLMFMTPGLIVVCFIFPIELPRDPSVWLMFAVMLVFSFFINSELNLLTGLGAFYIENVDGLIRLKRVIVDLFSGLLVPVALFPGWLAVVSDWLPFQAIAYLPSAVFTGRSSGDEAFAAIGLQAAWAVGLLVPILLMWRAARKRLFVQGG